MNVTLLVPELIVLLGALGVLMADLWLPREKKDLLFVGALVTAVAALASTWMVGLPDMAVAFDGAGTRGLQGSIVVDSMALFMQRAFGVCAIFVFLMSREYVDELPRGQGEFYALSLFALFGMFLTASVNDFMSLFVALETVTVSFFVLVAYKRDERKSIEAGLKLLVIGSLSAAILLYGIAFVYGALGTLNFDAIPDAIRTHTVSNELLLGAVLIFIGLGFKTSAVPLHVWVPDVYEGAPTPVTAYLSVGSKLAGFALVLRVFLSFAQNAELSAELMGFFALVAALTLFYGNLGALPQSNIKRLMGYSSIGQCGYILIGIAAGWQTGLGGVLFYMAAYVITNMVAFMVILLVGRALGSHELSDYRGLAKRSPLMAITMAMALFSLAGVPPFLGFFGKFMLLGSAFGIPELRWLVGVGLVNVVIAMYYYLSVVKRMYVYEPKDDAVIQVPQRLRLAMLVGLIVMVVAGLAPQLLEAPAMAVAETLPVAPSFR